MSLKKRSEGRQSPIVARAEFTYGDLPGTAFVEALQIPADAVILRGSLAVINAFNATSTISVGIAGDTDTYLTATAADAAGVTPLTGLTGACAEMIESIGITSSAAQSAGKGALVVEYIRTGRAHSTEG